MASFNKPANLHRVFFKRADRFNSFESGDKGQGKYKPGPPSGNTLGRAAPPPSPAVATSAPQAQPAPPPVPTPATLPHVPTGIPGYQIEKTVRDAEKSTRDMQRMNDQFANPFGRPDVLGATDGYGGRGNPLKLPPSQLPPQMRGVLEHEAPHLNKPPFIPPASPPDGLQ